MSTTSGSGASPRRILLYVGIVVGAAALLFAAFAMGDEAGPSVEEVAGSPEVVSGEPLPPAQDPASDPAAGGPAPVVSGTGFDGEEVTVGDGDAEILLFLASWCPACQAELPEVVEWLQRDGLPEGVDLTAVVTSLDDTRPNWPPQDWLEQEGFERPVIVDDAEGTIASTYGMSATPFWVFIADGEIQLRVAGQMGVEQLDAIAQDLADA